MGAHSERFRRYAGGLYSDSDAVLAALEGTGLSAAEIEKRMRDHLEGRGVRHYGDFEAWFTSFEIPDDEPADLRLWPHLLPAPPDEPSGDWERVASHYPNGDPVRHVAAET